MSLSLDALAVLDAIDRRGSFAAAAVELDRVPSAITYTVRRLEDDLDVLLFDRRGHRARLTPAGRLLLDDGRRLLAAADEIERRVQRVATGWETELRIAVDTLIPFARVFPLAASFFAECSARDAHTRLRFSHEVLGGAWDALAEGRADLVLGAPGDPPPGGGYRLRLLAEATMIFAVAPGHRWRRRRSRCRRRRLPGIAPLPPPTRRAGWRRVRPACWPDRTRSPCRTSAPSSPRRSRDWAVASCPHSSPHRTSRPAVS